jgi:sugar phosphate isomerase/epimerase
MPSSVTPSAKLSFIQVAQPGVVISNAWPQSRGTEGATLRAIEEVLAAHPFFEAFQTVDVPYPSERRQIRRLLGDQGRPHTYTLTRVLGEQKVSLSSLDPVNRQRAVDTVITQFEHAAEAGANTVAIISGPRPAEPHLRAQALASLEDSLTQLASVITRYPGMDLLIEPLDYEADKRNTLGSTPEAVTICRRLAARQLRLVLCIDTAHLILNNEDTVGAVALARDFITEFHFCNPVTDRASAVYGDRHIPFGPPGAVGIEEITTFMAGLHREGYLVPAVRPRVYCEVMQAAPMTPMDVVRHCEDSLLAAWAKVG